MSAPALLFYDRECRFCVWGVVHLARLGRPGAFRLAAIQGPLGEEHLGHIEHTARLSSWHLWDGTRLRSQADVLDGLGPMLASPVARAAILAVRSVPRPLTTAAYRLMAGNRVAISKLIPPGAKQRSADALPGFAADTGAPGSGVRDA
ncbi:DCC1-like thiol-disulfide oxidoreductase family protein [Patulibacter minatonensis]|uniref:DCC1-like thiol-disulfide oxidoreductase family protein n=1 Tax=Patulibacter minatonensis TaxID=298163 RepID=UPI000478F624|nr:DCC1-like thiol-disulfide oxidoreductase family protein [Patulibacter minatonensis]